MLKIYNSLTRRKEIFKPIIPNKVGIYVCGMTVYDYCHLGHARSMVCFDVVVRYLRFQGMQVKYVRNITDIDDKIIKRAQQEGEDPFLLANKFIKIMQEDTEQLYILPPDQEPRAVQCMPQIISLIKALIDNKYAYIATNGDVYYDVNRFKKYGELSHKDILGQEAGIRIDVVEVKRNPLDFVLWKQAKSGEPSWNSPWGKGRPGWHAECSAMAIHSLGETFDIHGGGVDLQFPHHENEIAQSEGVTGKPFVKTWMHVGFLQINRQKMSKSLKNFFTIREVLERYHPETIRYFLLSAHYRSHLNYSLENLISAEKALERFYATLRTLPMIGVEAAENAYEARFNAAMDDDFNTPEALAVLFDMTHEINRLRVNSIEQAARLGIKLLRLGQILGILNCNPNAFLQHGLKYDEVKVIEKLIIARDKARKDKDYLEADRIRNRLKTMNVELEDSTKGTTWRKL